MHRAENTDDRGVFAGLCTALREVADLYALPLILSVHPRIEAQLSGDVFGKSRVRPVPAMSFFEFIALERQAALVLTDSGTVQEECAIFRVPVITIRDTTERPETVEAGSNLVASTAPHAIVRAARFLQHQPPRGLWTPPQGYMTNHVSSIVVRLLLSNSDRAYIPATSPSELNADN
jgi:UDP-N-acetylglucosamine 2-epimerase (non-hydrolysing)